MKKTRRLFLASAVMAAAFTITACSNNDSPSPKPPAAEFSFSLYFAETGRTSTLYKGEVETLAIHEKNAGETVRTYTYELVGGATIVEDEEEVYYPASHFMTVTYHEDLKEFTVSPNISTEGQKIGIRVTNSEEPRKKKTQWFDISERHAPANTGYNFSSDTEKKSEILGELESYAMKNYLTGITLFENGGYVRKKSRVHYGTENYVTGYGFGLLTEGYLDLNDPEQPDVSSYTNYLQSAQSSDPGNISGWNATGSQVGDLYGYITSSFWGTKLNNAKTGYEWYPVLAAEDCPNPEPVDPETGVTIYKKYRVYVKTGNTPDGPNGEKYAVKYRQIRGGDYDSDPTKFNNRPVSIDDYITTFKLLLTQSSQLVRGAELATDTSYGFKGAYSYFRKTAKANDEQADKFWKDMTDHDQLGIKKGSDSRGDFIEFEFLNPIDVFTAKYTLSSSLYSPLPESYLKSIGGGSWINGGAVFGTGSKSTDQAYGKILENVLCVGPYMLEDWRTDKEIVFKRNDDWFEYVNTQGTQKARYRIDGVHFLIVTAATQRDDAIYDQFNAGLLDQTGIPASRMSEKVGSDKPTKGDATFKLNVNSCTQERWDDLFWSNKYPDVKKPTQHRNVHPWMSNKNFLDGLFWSINRAEFAESKGSTASYNYFADAYMDDPINGHSYNASDAHIKAENDFDPMLKSSGGYSPSKATSSFKAAIKELEDDGYITAGSYSSPTPLTIQIEWMYTNDETTYGQDIANYFYAAFDRNLPELAGYKLNVTHHADTNWEKVYNDHLMVGDFDLGFGAISGNTLNPLNFMEVLKSDNSSGFTLNWGKDTALVDDDDPITFDIEEGGRTVTREWSFDAAWAAADHGAVVQNGKAVDSVYKGHTTAPTNMAETQTIDRLAMGAIMHCPFEFVGGLGSGVEFEITRIQLSLVGYGSITIDESNIQILYELDEDNPEIRRVVGFKLYFDNTTPKPEYDDMTLSQYVNKMLFDGLHLQKQVDALDKTDPKYQEKKAELENPFAYHLYDAYWWIDVYYNITITGSVPTENYYMVKNIDDSTPSTSRGLANLGGR